MTAPAKWFQKIKPEIKPKISRAKLNSRYRFVGRGHLITKAKVKRIAETQVVVKHPPKTGPPHRSHRCRKPQARPPALPRPSRLTPGLGHRRQKDKDAK